MFDAIRQTGRPLRPMFGGLRLAAFAALVFLGSADTRAQVYQAADYQALLSALPSAKHTLADALMQVPSAEIPIEAKLEFEDGKLWLGVYTSEKALDVPAEENVFKEYKGDATADPWTPQTEVFSDPQHVARSAQYLTLLSMTSVTIPQIIDKAAANGQTTVFSVKEKVRNGKPIFEVLSVEGGAVKGVDYDLLTGLPM